MKIKTNSKHENPFAFKFKLLQIFLAQALLSSETVNYTVVSRSPAF